MKHEKYDYSDISRKYGYDTFEKDDIKKVYKKWKKNLSFQEKFCLFLYRIWSSKINRVIRNDEMGQQQSISGFYTFMDRGINSALAKGSIDRNIAVYRRVAKDEALFLESKELGDVISGTSGYGGYKGTHVDKTINEKYCNMGLPKAFAIFLVPQGTSCAYINYWVALFSMEHELLLNKDLTYELKEKGNIFGRPLYVLKVKEVST